MAKRPRRGQTYSDSATTSGTLHLRQSPRLGQVKLAIADASDERPPLPDGERVCWLGPCFGVADVDGAVRVLAHRDALITV
jgi:hypothetical protein